MTADTAAPSLKPCPFCGSSEVVCCDQGDDDFAVTCKSCWSHSPFSDSKPFAIAAWNTRATPTPTEAWERIRARAIADDDADEKELRRQLYHIEALAKDAITNLATPPAPTSSAARERIIAAVRAYCLSLSPASIQQSHGVERIYYSGLSVPELADAIATALLPDAAAIRADDVQDTYLVGGADLKAMSGDIDSNRVIKLHFRRRVTDKDREWLLEAINLKIKADQEAAAIRAAGEK